MAAAPVTVTATGAGREHTVANRVRLVVAQLLCGVGIASGVAVGGVLAEKLSGAMGAAGFAQTASIVGAGLMAIPLARLAVRHGRRWSLTLGFTTAAVGAALILIAAAAGKFWLYLIAMVLFGSGTATNLQSRYAAMEFSRPGAEARSMSIVLWATTVGSIAGPNLSAPGANLGRALGLIPLSGPYLFSLVGFVLAAIVTFGIRPIAGHAPGNDPAPGDQAPVSAFAALRAAVRSRHALFAIACVVTGQMMMAAVMVMTPVSMNNDGMSLEFIGIVISVHIVGMYAASPVFGWLTDKTSAQTVAWIGAALFVASFVLGAWDGAAHAAMPRLIVALFLLGLGWSACLIGGSAMLVESVPAHIRVPLQGAVDASMNFGAAALGALAGPVLALGGFFAVNVMAAAVLAILVWAGVRAGVRRA